MASLINDNTKAARTGPCASRNGFRMRVVRNISGTLGACALVAGIGGVLLGASANAAMANDGFADAQAVGNAMTKACMFNSLEFVEEFDAAVAAARDLGLTELLVNDKTAVFGNPAEAAITITRKVDQLACTLTLRNDTATHEYFETLETMIDAAFDATHPKHLEEISSDPSPHVDGHDWVASYPREKHHAITLKWGTEDGILLAVGFQQRYD